jgi:hypothetical protein
MSPRFYEWQILQTSAFVYVRDTLSQHVLECTYCRTKFMRPYTMFRCLAVPRVPIRCDFASVPSPHSLTECFSSSPITLVTHPAVRLIGLLHFACSLRDGLVANHIFPSARPAFDLRVSVYFRLVLTSPSFTAVIELLPAVPTVKTVAMARTLPPFWGSE